MKLIKKKIYSLHNIRKTEAQNIYSENINTIFIKVFSENENIENKKYINNSFSNHKIFYSKQQKKEFNIKIHQIIFPILVITCLITCKKSPKFNFKIFQDAKVHLTCSLNVLPYKL